MPPQAIGAAIIAAANAVIEFGGGGAGFFTANSTLLGVSSATIVGSIAINAVAIGAQLALTPGAPNPQSQKVNVRQPVSPRRRGYGEQKLGGTVALVKRSTVTGDGILYLAVMIHSGRIEGIQEHYLSNQIVRLGSESGSNGGTAIYPGVWNDNGRVAIHFHDGDSVQAADDYLLAGFPGAWTEQHTLDGIAYVVIRCKGVALSDFSTVYRAGIPTYNAVAKLSLVWDPRISGCEANDPSTWVYSDNAALVIMDYLWHADGMRLPRAQIELAIDRWIAVANCCDELVPLLNGGTEKRYRLAGVYDFSEAPKSVLSRMLLPIDGRLHLRADGAIVLDIGEFCDPAVTITDADILSYDMRRGPSRIDLKNEIRATYCAPGLNFEQQEADPWRNQASVDTDGLQSVLMNLDWCPSHSQARRRMKVEALRQNPEWQGTIVTQARGALLLGLRYATFQISDLGINTTFFLSKSNIDLLNGICTFDVMSFPSTAYDFDPETEEGVSPEANAPGDHGFVIPAGTTEIEITADGGGAGGAEDDGGGGGRVIKTVAIDPADWGTVLFYHVGAFGKGDALYPHSDLAENGEDSTVTGTVTAGAIAIVAGGGNRSAGTSPGAGGTATGGDTNTTGGFDGNSVQASGGPPNIDNDGFPGGGGWRLTDGANGSVTFKVTY